MSADTADTADRRPPFVFVAAVARAHERGYDGIRIAANRYATGHWRCRIHVPEPGGDGDGDVLADYSDSMGWDLFGDGRTAWTEETLAEDLMARARPLRSATLPDAPYVAWVAELRRRTGGGAFLMSEDAFSREHLWARRGLVSLMYADAEAARRDRERPGAGAVDENGWSLDGTMPVPPSR